MDNTACSSHSAQNAGYSSSETGKQGIEQSSDIWKMDIHFTSTWLPVGGSVKDCLSSLVPLYHTHLLPESLTVAFTFRDLANEALLL